MEIIVCIKQVISGDQIRFDPETHFLIRSREASRINPFDLSALAMAVEIKKEVAGKITAVTMGPDISEEVLWEALAVGADRAVLLTDPQFAASDTLATSYVLGEGIRKIGRFDLVLCGLRTSDSGTAQVGPQLAEELNMVHVTGVETVTPNGSSLLIERTSDGFREQLEVQWPVLLTVSTVKKIHFPSMVQIEDALIHSEIERWSLRDLKADPRRVGNAGSRTWVDKLIPITQQKSCNFIEGDSRQQAKFLVDQLIERGLLS